MHLLKDQMSVSYSKNVLNIKKVYQFLFMHAISRVHIGKIYFLKKDRSTVLLSGIGDLKSCLRISLGVKSLARQVL